MLTIDFKPIPFFSRYVINRQGLVLNIKNNNKIMKLKGKSVQLSSDSNNRTTRTIDGLVNLVWGKK